MSNGNYCIAIGIFHTCSYCYTIHTNTGSILYVYIQLLTHCINVTTYSQFCANHFYTLA